MRTISTSSYCPISARSGGTTSSSTASTSSTAVSCEAKALAYKFARFWALPSQGLHELCQGRPQDQLAALGPHRFGRDPGEDQAGEVAEGELGFSR